MFHRPRPAVAAAALATALAGLGCQSNTAPDAAVSLAELENRGVMGRFGEPLGTVVLAQGRVAAEAGTSGPLFLQVERINDRPLEEPILYPFDFESSEDFPSYEVGDAFALFGYETGRYTGEPAASWDRVETFATTGYGFETSFRPLAAEPDRGQSASTSFRRVR